MRAVFHAGEIEVQTRAGVRGMAQRVGSGIHDTMIVGAREFLADRPFVIVGGTDKQGHRWASILTGKPGFAQAVDARTVRIRADLASGDPLADALEGEAETELGLLVIDLKTRERMRLNGPARRAPGGSLLLGTHEVYFNCPKYIQKRDIVAVDPPETFAETVTREDRLTAEQCSLIAQADTFFIASAVPGGGADVSHRGGSPGFVHVRDASTLEWPDYSGNAMFNTLGNITLSPNAGLLFLDFERGDTLQLTGRADVVWEPERAAPFPGAERVVEFHIDRAIRTTHAVPLHFRLLQYSRFNPAGQAETDTRK